MATQPVQKRTIRVMQRDTLTVVGTSCGTILSAMMELGEETTGAIIALFVVLIHRWSPDLASRS